MSGGGSLEACEHLPVVPLPGDRFAARLDRTAHPGDTGPRSPRPRADRADGDPGGPMTRTTGSGRPRATTPAVLHACERQKEHETAGHVPMPCPGCGGPVPKRRTYCSRSCAALARRQPRPACPRCGAAAKRAARRFCGEACWRAWQKDHPTRYWHGKRRPDIAGPNHPNWRGDAAGPSAKRQRLRQRYPVPRRCRFCPVPGVRHPRDGDPGNPSPANLEWRCRGCLARFPRRPRRR